MRDTACMCVCACAQEAVRACMHGQPTLSRIGRVFFLVSSDLKKKLPLKTRASPGPSSDVDPSPAPLAVGMRRGSRLRGQTRAHISYGILVMAY